MVQAGMVLVVSWSVGRSIAACCGSRAARRAAMPQHGIAAELTGRRVSFVLACRRRHWWARASRCARHAA